MGTVPLAFHEYVMHYGAYYYVVTADVPADASAAQKEVAVDDGTQFEADMPVRLFDSAHEEWNEVDTVLGNVVTMKNNLSYTYVADKNAGIDHPYLLYGKGAFACAFALEYLCAAYPKGQFTTAERAAILAKIAELADWLLTQQCTNPALKAYGGFESSPGSSQCWSIDAGRCIPALLTAYTLTNNTDYLDAAVLAGYTFLYNMQHDLEAIGIVDTYYSGFSQYVNFADAYSSIMMTEDLYCLIGLKMLTTTYDQANAERYNAIMTDLVDFTREGFEGLWLYFQPMPYGAGTWYRVGLNNDQVYDDPMSFAMLGLYAYEGWSASNQRVYDFIQNINQSGTYSAYQPCVCWSGYINVVTRTPDSAYYDGVTIGILESIRKVVDKPSYELAYQIVNKYPDEFLFWGPKFDDYSPIIAHKAMANVSWIGRMFLNYSYPITDFTQAIDTEGERVLLYGVQQAQDTVRYHKALDMAALVQNVSVSELLLEAGYAQMDYLTMYSFLPVRPRDKIRRRGCDYEIQHVQKVISENQILCYKSQLRRLQNN